MDTFAIFPRALTLNIISEYSEYYGVHMFSIFGAGLEGGGLDFNASVHLLYNYYSGELL